ncbi:MAG: GAF domain-containing protein [Janthinobacterium lividum]
MQTLDSCEHEPIHALGTIQSHGALLCFDGAGRLIAISRTAAQWLGPLPPLGECLADGHLDPLSRQAIAAALRAVSPSIESRECTNARGQRFDLVLHWSSGMLMAEWEHVGADAPAAAHYAILAQQAIHQLQQRDYETVAELLQATVNAVRSMTGFDRVMGYRFLEDDSGEVIAEAKRDDLGSYLRQRYPAADIPAQARRLYLVNPIRQIASVDAVPVPIEPPASSLNGMPYDLSHSILRSVSPIHVEYLKNMGVAASMSISLVSNNRLWGLIACHHLSDHRSSYAVRLSCGVITHVVSILIERVEFKRRTQAEQRIRALARNIAETLTQAKDASAGLSRASAEIAQLIDCDAVSIVVDDQVPYPPDCPDRQGLLELAAHMASESHEQLLAQSMTAELAHLPRPLTASGEAAGLLAIQLMGEARITVVWLRDELVKTINWAGSPDKIVALGPNGPRATPRGSFELWQQTVRGSSRAWSSIDRFAARELKSVLQDVELDRLRSGDRQRMTLLAMLGHDLRDPLQAIQFAVDLMDRGLASSSDTSKRVEGSTRRMQSLINYILDVSRIRSGIGLHLTRSICSLDDVLSATVEQARLTHPGMTMLVDSDELGDAELDPDRFVQALSNLLGNARQHGDISAPVRIVGRRVDGLCSIEICNRTLNQQHVPLKRLVDPFKSASFNNANNRTGLGLGLYIANAIIVGHGARLSAEFDANEARFTVTLAPPALAVVAPFAALPAGVRGSAA